MHDTLVYLSHFEVETSAGDAVPEPLVSRGGLVGGPCCVI